MSAVSRRRRVATAAALMTAFSCAVQALGQSPEVERQTPDSSSTMGAGVAVEEIEAALHRAYDAQFTATERAQSFAAAAGLASDAGAHVEALAWIEWALRETEQMRSDPRRLGEVLHTEAIRIALTGGDPVRARSFARRYGALARGWTDEPEMRAVLLAPLDARCPDVIDDRFVRVRIERGPAPAGDPQARSARCFYEPFAAASAPNDVSFVLVAHRSWSDARGRLRGAIESGLDPEDAALRASLAAELPVLTTQVEREPEASPFAAGHVLLSRAGRNDVTSITYALDHAAGTLRAARVSANERDWPSTELLELANAGVAAMAASR